MDIESHKRWLVEQGDALGRAARANKDWKHQLRTVWEAARKESEPLVIRNLLRYQAARNWETWGVPHDAFAQLDDQLQECSERAGNGNSGFAMELIRHLMAYAYRSYTFYSENSRANPEE